MGHTIGFSSMLKERGKKRLLSRARGGLTYIGLLIRQRRVNGPLLLESFKDPGISGISCPVAEERRQLASSFRIASSTYCCLLSTSSGCC